MSIFSELNGNKLCVNMNDNSLTTIVKISKECRGFARQRKQRLQFMSSPIFWSAICLHRKFCVVQPSIKKCLERGLQPTYALPDLSFSSKVDSFPKKFSFTADFGSLCALTEKNGKKRDCHCINKLQCFISL